MADNAALRALMSARNIRTREQLSDAVINMSIKLTGVPLPCSPRQVGRFLNGETAWPNEKYRAPLEALFGVPAGEMGFTPPPGYDGAMVRGNAPSSTALGSHVLRRHFLLGLGTALALPTLPGQGRLGVSDVDAICAATAELHALDDRHGGVELADVAARYVEHVELSVRACTCGASVRRRLHAAVGGLAASAGWFAYDGGSPSEARRWWDMALRYSLLAEDSTLQARVWSYMARLECDLGHGDQAVAIARHALDATRNRRDPRLSALLHARVALGQAVSGERGRAGQSLHRADLALDRATTTTAPWLEFVGPAEITGQAALVDYHLGRYRTAADRDENALELLPTGFGRNSFATQVSLARNRLAAGRADEALSAAHRALDLMGTARVRSPRWGKHLARFVGDVQRNPPTGATEFADRYREVVAS
ncbi:hypothetical protein VSR01_28405 [Actinacidiphila sp. DG2A-62]|uniref:hypothetical protein n=1 Tax=Actinacidiphila sp. DG2A-62 TaxID=3108821 RepID=UPI002DBA0266|nr:hypothetical protein [Actinacidiphila sp. DG2A-62]MEC3997213.1 hypothetical protein [Actinacidiphila sp. DG2A-62]